MRSPAANVWRISSRETSQAGSANTGSLRQPLKDPKAGRVNRGISKVTLAAFLQMDCAAHVKTAVPNENLLLAHSWQELDSILATRSVSVAVLDPSASGWIDLTAVISLLRKYPSLPFLAYVSLTEQNFRAIATLSNHGLADAIVHPADAQRFCKTIETLSRTRLVREFLGPLEVALGTLSPGVLRALQDLFERPHRYETGADIAASARTPAKNVYRDFQNADLGTPKKLVTVAKLLCGYAHLKNSRLSIKEICVKLGYPHPRVFSEHTTNVFACRPSSLRNADDDEVKSLLDWFYKPCGRSIGRKPPSLKGPVSARGDLSPCGSRRYEQVVPVTK